MRDDRPQEIIKNWVLYALGEELGLDPNARRSHEIAELLAGNAVLAVLGLVEARQAECGAEEAQAVETVVAAPLRESIAAWADAESLAAAGSAGVSRNAR